MGFAVYLRIQDEASKQKLIADEIEWTRMWKALNFLDLPNHKRMVLSRYYREKRLVDEEFQSPWISTSGKGFPVDDCRATHDWFNSDRHLMSHHLSMVIRRPDWIGRNLFLEYVKEKIVPNQRYLESGKSAVRFMNFAERCGFPLWKDSEIGEKCYIADYVFSKIYPAILRGLYDVREEHPLVARKLWDMFRTTNKSLGMMFARMPDAQHLQFLLDVAVKCRIGIWSTPNQWGIEDDTYSFSYLDVIIGYIVQKRYDLVLMLLRYGLPLKCDPLGWYNSIYMGLWTSGCDFTASPEFKEVLLMCIMVTPFPCPLPLAVHNSLMTLFRKSLFLDRLELDACRGMAIINELVGAHATCGFFNSHR